jgi:Xaa-Pro aminopeptidase
MSADSSSLVPPPRGFERAEFETRTQAAQRLMAAADIDALFFTTEPEIRYFTGFHSQFWESPTRPWFLLLPAEGKPIAVIPEIGVAGMASTWIDDIRGWPAPRPADDGISLLVQAISEVTRRHGRLGVPLGHETSLRMPMGDFQDVCGRLRDVEMVDATGLLRALREIKSAAEIAKIRYICQLTSLAFEALPASSTIGETERQICRRLKIDLQVRGADSVPYLIGASGPGGYDNIIMGPTDRVLEDGDLLIIDTGATYDGYFCDFDRNYAFGQPDDAARRAHDAVYAATEAGFAAARPGATAAALCAAMWAPLEAAGALGNDVGRLGHGLGMQLTEPPSNMAGDDTVMKPGMVMTLEPGMTFAPGKMMVHEENLVIREDGAEWLTRRAPREMPVIG